jgi:DnaK suppressor protein
MNMEHFKAKLLAREQELQSEITTFEGEALNSRTAEVEDSTDRAVSDEAKSSAFETSATAAANLTLVRDALQRIKDGTFGKCVDCGRQIEEARLEAVPWTPYCLEDQQKHDQASPLKIGATL